MALTIDDPEVERLAEELAAKTGEPVSVALGRALRHELAHEEPRRPRKSVEEILADLRRRVDHLPRLNADKTDDELIGYNQRGHFD